MEEVLYEKNNSKQESEVIEEMEKLARKNFTLWNEALLSKDSNRVASLYTKDNTFLPTVSGDFKKGIEGAENYFTHFLEKDPNGQIVEDVVQTISPDSYLHSGMYNFEVGPADNRSMVEARFTFLWQKSKHGNWKIAHHHSSIRPKN